MGIAFRLRITLAGILLLAPLFLSTPLAARDECPAPTLPDTLAAAQSLDRLHTLIVSHHGKALIERRFGGPGLDRAVNVKSVAKTVIAALVGIAIERDLLDGLDQPVAPILAADLPARADPRLARITVENLLSMQAGLERTSGANYGRWVTSPNWVRFALSRPFVDEPGGRMLYSTGSSHLLSAVLTRATKRTTLSLAREWLGEPLDIKVPAWDRDPQGVYFGGNNMALSPRALLRLGETYRNGGMFEGRRVVPESWVRASWTPRTRSPFTGDAYGLGWFITQFRDHPVYYAWGYGGQLLHVVPDLGLTVVMTSDTGSPSGRTGYADDLHRLVADTLIPEVAAAAECG